MSMEWIPGAIAGVAALITALGTFYISSKKLSIEEANRRDDATRLKMQEYEATLRVCENDKQVLREELAEMRGWRAGMTTMRQPQIVKIGSNGEQGTRRKRGRGEYPPGQ